MTQQDIVLALSVGNFFLTWGVALYMYLANKNKATNERIGKLEDDIVGKIDGHGDRITRLETQADVAPNHDHLARLHGRIDEVAGIIKHLSGEFSATSKTIDLIHASLMRDKK